MALELIAFICFVILIATIVVFGGIVERRLFDIGIELHKIRVMLKEDIKK